MHLQSLEPRTSVPRGSAQRTVVLLLAGAMLGVAIAVGLLTPPPPSAVNVTFSPPVADFAELAPNDRGRVEVMVRNNGTTALTVDDITLSCSCVGADPSTFTVNPGEEKLLVLRILTPSWQRSPFRFEARLRSQQLDDPIVLAIVGTTSEVFVFEPDAGEHDALRAVTMRAEDDSDFAILEVPWFIVPNDQMSTSQKQHTLVIDETRERLQPEASQTADGRPRVVARLQRSEDAVFVEWNDPAQLPAPSLPPYRAVPNAVLLSARAVSTEQGASFSITIVGPSTSDAEALSLIDTGFAGAAATIVKRTQVADGIQIEVVVGADAAWKGGVLTFTLRGTPICTVSLTLDDSVSD
ncbi:MAG: DUF1573 domain-containing protein [Phycisphaerales bacterium]